MTPNEQDKELENALYHGCFDPWAWNKTQKQHMGVFYRDEALKAIADYRASIEAPLNAEVDRLREAINQAVKAYDSHPAGIIDTEDVLIWAQTTMTEAIGKLRVTSRALAAIANAEKEVGV